MSRGCTSSETKEYHGSLVGTLREKKRGRNREDKEEENTEGQSTLRL